jgi:hypothetical protein
MRIKIMRTYSYFEGSRGYDVRVLENLEWLVDVDVKDEDIEV